MKTTLSSRAEQIVREADDAESRELLRACTTDTPAPGEKQVPPRAN